MRRAARLAETSINAHEDRLKGCGTAAAQAGELDVIRPENGGRCYRM